jgi:hypothetical protein
LSNLFVDKISGKSGTSSGAPITLSGDTATLGSGVTVPAAGITGVLPVGVTGGSGLNAIPGTKILQVKSAFSDTYATHSNTSIDAPANLTGMSVAITPASTSSKIALMGHIVGSFDNANSQMLGMLFKRGTTELGEGDASTWTGNTGVGEAFVVGQPDYYNPSTVSGFFVDSPGVDTEITYYLAAFANRYTSSLVPVTFIQGGSGYAYTTHETAVGSCQMIVMEFDPS